MNPRPTGLQITLAALLGTHIMLAAVFVVSAPLRFSSPAFTAGKQVAPLHAWAAVFAALAVGLAVCYQLRRALALQLVAGMFVYLFWGACYMWSATYSPAASFIGPIIWTFVAVVQIAAASTILGPGHQDTV
jgi:hypothetical protein